MLAYTFFKDRFPRLKNLLVCKSCGLLFVQETIINFFCVFNAKWIFVFFQTWINSLKIILLSLKARKEGGHRDALASYFIWVKDVYDYSNQTWLVVCRSIYLSFGMSFSLCLWHFCLSISSCQKTQVSSFTTHPSKQIKLVVVVGH